MPDQGQYRQQQNQQTQNRTREAEAPPISQPEYSPPTAPPDPGKKSGFQMGPEKRTAGKAGESNLSVERIEEWVGHNRSARFNVKTAPGNSLEVTIHQESYHRPYTGVGAAATGLIPVAPIGTKGKVVCIDTTTGETLERPWRWQLLGRGFGLWQLIKNLIWKG